MSHNLVLYKRLIALSSAGLVGVTAWSAHPPKVQADVVRRRQPLHQIVCWEHINRCWSFQALLQGTGKGDIYVRHDARDIFKGMELERLKANASEEKNLYAKIFPALRHKYRGKYNPLTGTVCYTAAQDAMRQAQQVLHRRSQLNYLNDAKQHAETAMELGLGTMGLTVLPNLLRRVRTRLKKF